MGPSHPGVNAPKAATCPRQNPKFFQKNCNFFAAHFFPSVCLGQVLVEARESYSDSDVSRSLIFYFAVAGGL